MRADAERATEIIGQGADVGALAANYPEVGRRPLNAGNLKLGDGDAAGLHLYGLAPAGFLVEPFAAHADGRMGRRELVNGPDKPLRGPQYVLVGDGGQVKSFINF